LKKIYSVYQPIIEVATKNIVGYEALTRGLGKERLPENLFRRAYDDGSAVHFDLRCLITAFQILPRLPKQAALFVNIEPITLTNIFSGRHDSHGAAILDKISAFGKQVVFELTEGMKVRDFELVKKAVALIRNYKCRFAIDDVAGIGAKLLKLVSLKPQFIKIDITLVKGLSKNRFHQLLVQRIVELGEENGCGLIAEGVETKHDLELIQKYRIPYAQGFYFSKPQKKLLKPTHFVHAQG